MDSEWIKAVLHAVGLLSEHQLDLLSIAVDARRSATKITRHKAITLKHHRNEGTHEAAVVIGETFLTRESSTSVYLSDIRLGRGHHRAVTPAVLGGIQQMTAKLESN